MLNLPSSRPLPHKLLLACLLIASPCYAHIAAWHKGMYCLKGNVEGVDNQDNNQPVNPLYRLTKNDWWFHHVDRCDQFPPAEGDFLELPAGGSFTVEMSMNRAFTTLAYDGKRVADFPDGKNHPGLGVTSDGKDGPEGCIVDPNIHATDENNAAGTAFAISYTPKLSEVTPENLVVFSVLYHTPWRRLATYQVPELPACPEGGCTCAWGWVPNGCGEPNMYMQGFKCRVVGRTGSRRLAPAQPPVWCEGDSSKCVKGAKQMIYWNQLDGNNVEVSGTDPSGRGLVPTYNMRMGFPNGAQNDIFAGSGTARREFVEPSVDVSRRNQSRVFGSYKF